MNKKKVTINIEYDKWKRYLARCKELGSDGSAEFTKFVDCFLEGKSYKYESEADWENLPESVKVFEEILVERILLRLEHAGTIPKREEVKEEWNNGNSKASTETDGKTGTAGGSSLNRKGIAQKPLGKTRMLTEKVIETDAMPKNLKSDSNWKPEDSMKIKREVLASEPIFEEEIADGLRECFTDAYVGKEERVSKSTITRRRNTQRKANNPEFWERWEVSTLNPNRWWRVATAKPDSKGANKVAS